MKALVCGRCGDIHALQDEWRTCKCGAIRAHWVDGERGIAEFDAPAHLRRYGFLLGLHNGVLIPALRGELGMFSDFRAAAEAATDAPNSVFDKGRGNAWAVVVRVGATGDVSWVQEAESEPPNRGLSNDREGL